MKQSHSNIPIFLPELACPHRCVFCNQSHISQHDSIPSASEAKAIIERNLTTLPPDCDTQVAFFGGSFTGLPVLQQEEYLSVVQPFIDEGKVSSIRISTRPDYIDDGILAMLKSFRVKDIELGAQSTDDDVLQRTNRGHDRQAIEHAAKKIKDHGFTLGLQMMLGLPGDTFERTMQTARDIIHFGAETTRIYPTLVVADTHLAHLYKQGEYQPLALETAVQWTKSVFAMFLQYGITVLKVGLHPNEDFLSKKHLLAGPFHPSFKELVLTEMWRDAFQPLLQKGDRRNISIFVNQDEKNHAIGYNGTNRRMLLEAFRAVQFKTDNSLYGHEYTYCHY